MPHSAAESVHSGRENASVLAGETRLLCSMYKIGGRASRGARLILNPPGSAGSAIPRRA